MIVVVGGTRCALGHAARGMAAGVGGADGALDEVRRALGHAARGMAAGGGVVVIAATGVLW